MESFQKIASFFDSYIWEADPERMGWPRAFLLRALRVIYGSYKEFKANELELRAMGLVYSTLLAIVPLLALSFSVLKAFGVHNQLRDALESFFMPLGDKAPEITSKILEFVDNIRVGVLSAVGLGLLVYTVILLIQKIEGSVNYIWKVEKPRSIARRFSDYMSVLLTGPVLIFSALGLKALFLSHSFIQRLLSIEVFGLLFYALGKTIPFVFICLSFTFVIIFIPNTKVKFRSALVGGIISGISWQFTGWVFSSFVVTSARYVAVYSSFAVLFLFILWLYLNWLIVLIGAQVAYCHQNIETFYVKKKVVEYGGRLKEKLCFLVMYLIGFHFHYTGKRLTATDIASHLGHPPTHVNKTLDLLEKEGLLLQTADDPPAYIPARDIDTIRLTDILDAARTPTPEEIIVEKEGENLTMVNELVERLEGALRSTLGKLSLKDFVTKTDSPATLKAKT